MIAAHLPALQVVVPLILAPMCIVFRSATIGWQLAVIGSWSSFAIALGILQQVTGDGVIVYELGDWAAPWGIEYRIDNLGAFVLVIVTAIASVVVAYAKTSIEREIPPARRYLFHCMYLLCLSGLLGMTVTGDTFNLFVFLEISSLSTYVLISFGRDRRALTAAYRYLIMGTVGATFYIIGVGMMYMMTGTLNMADLAQKIPEVADTRTIQVALAFLTVGLALKIAMFPLHLWLPNAYCYAPSAVTVFLAATATKVAIYAFIRIVFTVFGTVQVFETFNVQGLLMILAIAGMFAGSAVAIYQTNVKRLMAYSSVAQIGYIMLGVSFATVSGLTGGIIHLFNHALTKGGIFMALGCIAYRLGSVNLDDMAGIGRKMPATMLALVIGGLSLIGVPLTAGFISKWYLIRAALETGSWPIAVLVLLSSLLAVIYVWRIVETAYFRQPSRAVLEMSPAPLSLLIPTWVLIGGAVYFGIDATTTIDVAAAAAEQLIGGSR